MSNDIKTWPATKTIVPVSVEEFKKRQPALLGAIREVVREELAAREESPAFGDGRFLLTIQLGASYGLSFHCDAHDLYELAEAAAQALKTARPESNEPSMTRPSEDAYEPHPTTSIPRDSHTSPRRGR